MDLAIAPNTVQVLNVFKTEMANVFTKYVSILAMKDPVHNFKWIWFQTKQKR